MGNIKTESVLSSSDNCINIPGDYGEFSLMGRWFEDSIIIRWAEITTDFKHQPVGVTKAYVLGKLLQISYLKRDTNKTRNEIFNYFS